jgi:hypothetical protein
MLETTKSNDLKGAYLSPMSRKRAEDFFGVEKEVTNKIGRSELLVRGIACGDGPKKT